MGYCKNALVAIVPSGETIIYTGCYSLHHLTTGVHETGQYTVHGRIDGQWHGMASTAILWCELIEVACAYRAFDIDNPRFNTRRQGDVK